MSQQKEANNAINVVGIQFSPRWQQARENCAYLEKQLDTVLDADLIVLPEMFSTGFSLNQEAAECDLGETFQWMSSLAKSKHACVVGSIKVAEDKKLFNRLYWVFPDGAYQQYDKWHLFGAENKWMEPGTQRVIVEYKSLRFLVQTCYDLRFPVFSRNTNDYDVLLNIASWPKPRIHHWNMLLQARAVENLSYVIGVNRIGRDENNWEYVGESQVIHPDGSVICKAEYEQEDVIQAVLSKNVIDETRKTFPFLNDQDAFILKPKS